MTVRWVVTLHVWGPDRTAVEARMRAMAHGIGAELMSVQSAVSAQLEEEEQQARDRAHHQEEEEQDW